jgi:hypothetical protein
MSGHPNDQADGFFGNGEDDAWQFIFDLDSLSENGLWADMRARIAAFTGDIPFHDFSENAFRRAAAEGKTDIAGTMLSRGFFPPEDAGAALLLYLAERSPVRAAGVIGLLLGKGYDASGAIYAIAEHGAPETMEAFKKHGCDILSGGAFALSLHAGNAPMMRCLYNAGADLYAPAVVAGLYGGIETYQSANRDHVAGSPAAARAAYAALRDEDAMMWRRFFAATAPDVPSLDGFRAVPAGVARQEMTLMQIAARAGCCGDIVTAALRDEANPLTADDALRTDAGGASVLSILAARGEAEKLFDARLWWKRPGDAALLHAALKKIGADDVADPAAFAADIQRQRLRNLARAAHVRLRPQP